MKRVTLKGISIDILSVAELSARLALMLRGNRAYHIVTVNPEFIVAAERDAKFRTILATADLATADGTGIILASRFRGIPARFDERITGVALTEHLLRLANNHRYPVIILLKDDSLVNERALADVMQNRYPNVPITIFREPYAFDAIVQSAPRILFSALGAPAQEYWIREHMKDIPGLSIAVGIGGTFDLLSGTIQRAPMALQQMGLEWLWRLVREPKRLPRIIRATVVFLYFVIAKRI